MCDTITMLDGTELSTPGELIDRGLATPDQFDGDETDYCLCGIYLDGILNPPNVWPPRFRMGAMGWDEIDTEGRTWWKDAYVAAPEQDPTLNVIFTIPNPDYPYHAPSHRNGTTSR